MVAMSGHEPDHKQKFTHAAELDHAELVSLLEDLLAGVRSGELALERGHESMRLRPQGPIAVDLRARHKHGRESLRVELEWDAVVVEPVLRVGPAPEPAPIEARRRGVVALRTARRSEVESTNDAVEPSSAPAEPVEVDAVALARLPKERLYALAKAVELDGRSQLHKTALARALAECDLEPHLRDEDHELLRGG
jgi:amphi-Trp domain-containing protein